MSVCFSVQFVTSSDDFLPKVPINMKSTLEKKPERDRDLREWLQMEKGAVSEVCGVLPQLMTFFRFPLRDLS